MATQRGLVVSPPIELVNDRIHVKSSVLDPQELRFSLLFWDRLEQPSSKLIYFASSADGAFLEKENILQRTPWQSAGGVGGELILEPLLGVFKALDQKEPGVWSIATGKRSISFPDTDIDVGRGALVELHRAIPVPDKDVPLQDILEFRVRRKAELHALRYHLEAVYQRILGAGDGALAMNSEVDALQASIADHIRVSKETGLKFRAVSLNASLNLFQGARLAVAAFTAGLPMVSALMAGALAVINVGPGTALTWGKPTGTPFRYVSAYHEQVF